MIKRAQWRDNLQFKELSTCDYLTRTIKDRIEVCPDANGLVDYYKAERNTNDETGNHPGTPQGSFDYSHNTKYGGNSFKFNGIFLVYSRYLVRNGILPLH